MQRHVPTVNSKQFVPSDNRIIVITHFDNCTFIFHFYDVVNPSLYKLASLANRLSDKPCEFIVSESNEMRKDQCILKALMFKAVPQAAIIQGDEQVGHQRNSRLMQHPQRSIVVSHRNIEMMNLLNRLI